MKTCFIFALLVSSMEAEVRYNNNVPAVDWKEGKRITRHHQYIPKPRATGSNRKRIIGNVEAIQQKDDGYSVVLNSLPARESSCDFSDSERSQLEDIRKGDRITVSYNQEDGSSLSLCEIENWIRKNVQGELLLEQAEIEYATRLEQEFLETLKQLEDHDVVEDTTKLDFVERFDVTRPKTSAGGRRL